MENENTSKGGRKFGCLHVAIFLLVAMVVTAGATFWIVRTYVFPSEFQPVTLDDQETRELDLKIEKFETASSAAPPSRRDRGDDPALPDLTSDPLNPDRYSEDDARREIAFTETELNALIARNPDLARRLAIDLSEDLVSAKLLVPLDEDFPIFGGQVLRVRAGLELAYDRERPVVVLRGVSIMGVPIPKAWMGGMKNVDLVEEFGGDGGFWTGLAEGIEHVRVDDGSLRVKLKE